MSGITGRNGAHSGGLRSPIIIYHNPRQSGRVIHSYGTLAIDVCTGQICVHDGVTPGGCFCFHQQVPVCDQIAAWPDFGNVCPPVPDPAPFDPCALLATLPDVGAICAPVPAPAAFDPCAVMTTLPDIGVICPPTPTPVPFDPCTMMNALPDVGVVCP